MQKFLCGYDDLIYNDKLTLFPGSQFQINIKWREMFLEFEVVYNY